MPKIKVYGKRLPRTVQVQLPDSRTDTSKLTSPERNMKAAFAHMRELAPRLRNISADDVWEYFKSNYGGVESRTEISEMDWASIAARLYAAKTDPKLRANLNEEVRRFKNEQTNNDRALDDTVQ